MFHVIIVQARRRWSKFEKGVSRCHQMSSRQSSGDWNRRFGGRCRALNHPAISSWDSTLARLLHIRFGGQRIMFGIVDTPVDFLVGRLRLVCPNLAYSSLSKGFHCSTCKTLCGFRERGLFRSTIHHNITPTWVMDLHSRNEKMPH
eukprot:scaffold18668_cov164-Amphora_coffeaeformis.AAC.8